MRRSALVAFAVAWATPALALAHDFWLQPTSFNLRPKTATPLLIFVGHGPFRTRWSGVTDRVVLLRSEGPNGSVDQKAILRPTPDKDGDLGFPVAGDYVLAFQSTPAESVLPAIRYNDYIKAEGLTPAIRLREQTGATGATGREIYSRRAKAIIHVGEPNRAQPWVTRPVGLSLEIVPDKDPYGLAPGEALPLRILFDGKPLAGALVKLTNLEFDIRPVAAHLSDGGGRTSFIFPRTGTWQVNVIWTRPLNGDARADFDTTFSSLTFGYAAAR